ncbi:ABC transporter permease [Pseudorhodoferax sp.]|uniref:ABC transporter permease n=1 Tax=Pseudorhodoferax sp. TaxID=1993553 RepID=UPI002DD67A8D|nr:ABC transporter permease subunit [Pseudorhodoferax sp.]
MNDAWVVLCKELRDALRDRRTLLVVLLSSVAIGPLVLVLLSTLVAGFEQRAEAREVVVHGIEHAPSLHNFLERQTYRVKPAPSDYEQQLLAGRLGDPVVVITPGFEADLAAARAPLVEVVASSDNKRAQSGAGRTLQLLRAFNQEQATLRLALRGVSPALLEAVQVEARDLAEPAARGAQLTAMVPFFVLMAMVYGALNAALDTTAGERERGSLEPLLSNPGPRVALVLGKWAAVTAVALLIAVLGCLSFLPGQWLLRSDSLAAMFRFGLPEALWFIGLLAPLAGALSALLMAVALRCRSVKEAQANSAVLLMAVSLLPLVTLFSAEGEARWHLWVPALAQVTLMGRVLKGSPPGVADLAVPLLVCLLLTVACVLLLARTLHRRALG